MKRREEIKELLKDRGEITLKELEEKFPESSGVTLRRDLKFLEEQGALKRTHGGAVALHALSLEAENIYSRRATECVDEKCQIAQKALKYIEPGRSIFIDAGSTMMQFVKEMPDEYLSVLTSGVNIALELIKKPKVSVTLIGGQVNRNTVAVSGANCTRFIQEVNIDTAFLAASGFSVENGFTTGTYTEAEIKKEVLGRARRVIILMDSTKMDKVLPFTFAQIEDISALVSDGGLNKDVLRYAMGAGVEIV